MPLRKLIMKGETNMKYRRVITMLASASLAISIPVTSLAAEVNLVVLIVLIVRRWYIEKRQ